MGYSGIPALRLDNDRIQKRRRIRYLLKLPMALQHLWVGSCNLLFTDPIWTIGGRVAKDRMGYVRFTVVTCIIHDFDKFPEEYRKILFELAKDEDVKITVARAIIDYFDKFPEEYRKIFL
ncbi:MAG: hypothetical protein HXS48_07085 [Theionarchaea archaeon]|nr:MAG: hypothetical protein AYK19_10140 [Theionarchaea archaeon DG-70-1]MBU7026690.1 hypothetical protein [Theionarchaea archaeon]